MNILCWSGGKDSTASIILDHFKNGHQIDEIVTSLIYFDKKRGIYADHPKTIEFIFKAKKIFESWGYKVTIISSDKDYLYWFFKRRGNRCKHKEYCGKLYGWVLGSMCHMNGEKVQPIKKYLKQFKDVTEYVGIGIEETPRLERLHKRGQISLLEKFNMTCEDAKKLCVEYDLLSPTYETSNRGGCWFCPNSNVKQFIKLKKEHPELWNELVELNKYKDEIVTNNFTYGKTFDEIQREVDLCADQISIFDLVDEKKDEVKDV